MKKLIALIVAFLCFVSISAATASISGKVQSQMGKVDLKDALVILLKHDDESFSKTVVSNANGYFFIDDVGTGVYNVEVVKDGYYKNVLFDLKVESDKSYTVNVKLLRKAKKDDSDYCFMLGGIEVCSEQKDIIPEELVTTRKVSSGEIEHMQASSLGDVLSLIPGVEKSQNQGLSEASYVGLRSNTIDGNEGVLEAFGSTIIIDGNEISNDVNASNVTGRGGVDLRTIPADNIESVEVITGIPSVEYGNFSNGIIKVKTKEGILTPKLKVKLNPDTKTASFTNGFKINESVFDYHLNYGYSERDVRYDNDEYQRIYLKSTYTGKTLQDRLKTKISGSYTKTIDGEQPTDVVLQMKDYTRGYSATGDLNLEYDLSDKSKMEGFFGLDFKRVKDLKQKWVNEPWDEYLDSLGLTSLGNDTTFRDTIYHAGYVGSLKENAKEWNWTARIINRTSFNFGKATHKVLGGMEWDYKTNTGEGVIIDSVLNYYGLSSTRKSYSYADYLPLQELSIFIEDDILTYFLNRKLKIMGGLRYDGISSINTFDMKHGSFLCPRFNVQYFISDNFRVRFGTGKSVKTVSLSYINRYPDYEYVPITSLAGKDTLVEMMQLQNNPNLKGYSSNKYEMSVDWKPADLLGITITGYHLESDNKPTLVSYPWGYDVNPDTITEAGYGRYENRGWSNSNGVEISLKTKRIKHLQFQMNITYRTSKSGSDGFTYDSPPDTSWESVWYLKSSTKREKIILDYRVNYISQRLGVWITAEVQHIPLDKYQYLYHSNSTMKDINGTDYLFYQGMSYWYDREPIDYGSRWIMNFRLTKSITEGTELSMYINNVFDDRAVWGNPYTGKKYERNPNIFFGVEVSSQW